MAFFGGFGTLLGPILGGLILESTQQYFTVTFSGGSLGSLYLIIFGALFLVVILFAPKGIVIYVRDWWERRSVRSELVAASAVPPSTGGP
jgi:ABC-type branched-subunit amino acid transport system permease subunit